MHVPRILLCAPSSGSGKTLITCGLLQALKNRGMKIASFKCGPDYIDPMFHTKVIGTKSRNLDPFFTSPKITNYLLAENSKDADLSVLEGVMGYYDGLGGTTTGASTYELACDTETPAILIVNCKGMSVSILPLIQGFLNYKENNQIAGVILNQMSGMLYPRVKKMIEEELSVPVLGYLPRVEDCILESRHLGLIMPYEIEHFREKLEKLADIIEKTFDMEQLIKIAQKAPELSVETPWKEELQYNCQGKEKVRIGMAYDEAFSFLYEDNLQLLERMGAEIVPFSPVHDSGLPEGLDGLLLYGGYPELVAEQLEKNSSMRKSIFCAYENGIPVIAECGGFMYLHKEFEDSQGILHQGVGIIDGKVYKTDSLKRFGYIYISSKNGNVFGNEMHRVPAHEFHYYDSTSCGRDFLAEKPIGSRTWECIHGKEHLLAGFPHFYYYGAPEIPKAFLQECRRYHKNRIRKEEKSNE